MAAVVFDTWVDWECPNCHYAERTRPIPANSSRMHDCPKLHGLSAPLLQAGSDCKVIAVERGDYLRDEEQRTGDDRRPYMAVEAWHADGHNDAWVFAPVATFGLRRNKQ